MEVNDISLPNQEQIPPNDNGNKNLYEAEDNELEDQINSEIRLGFIKKVYGILSAQLLITSIFTTITMFNKSIQDFIVNNTFLLILVSILTIIFPLVIICSENALRKVPNNYIILGLFTLCESYLVSSVCAYTDPDIVFMAAVITFCMVVSLTVYAWTTKEDFTYKGGALFLFSCGILVLILFAWLTRIKIFYIILTVLSAICFSFYLIYDTQVIVSSKKLILQEDDYIFGAFSLYTDIIYIFIRVLEILRYFNKN